MASFLMGSVNPQYLLGVSKRNPKLVEQLENEYLQIVAEAGGLDSLIKRIILKWGCGRGKDGSNRQLFFFLQVPPIYCQLLRAWQELHGRRMLREALRGGSKVDPKGEDSMHKKTPGGKKNVKLINLPVDPRVSATRPSTSQTATATATATSGTAWTPTRSTGSSS